MDSENFAYTCHENGAEMKRQQTFRELSHFRPSVKTLDVFLLLRSETKIALK